jgi:hypothetical protein
LHFFFGFGPDSMLNYFSHIRSPLVDVYFPSDRLIDSSHSIIMDFIFQYGIVLSIILLYICRRSWRYMSPSLRMSTLLGIIFLSLNVMVVSHMIVLILIFVSRDRPGDPMTK